MKHWAIVLGMAGLAAGQGLAAESGTAPAVAPAAVSAKAAGEVAELLSSGRQSLQAEKWTEATALFEKALKLDPASDEAMFGLSVAYIQLEKYAEALPLLQKLNQQVPSSPMVKNNLAWVYVKSKDPAVRDPQKAVKLARAAVLDVPSDYSIWNTLAEAYYAAGQFDRALRAAQSALRLSTLAGVTNSAASRELVVRCRKAAGAAELDEMGGE